MWWGGLPLRECTPLRAHLLDVEVCVFDYDEDDGGGGGGECDDGDYNYDDADSTQRRGRPGIPADGMQGLRDEEAQRLPVDVRPKFSVRPVQRGRSTPARRHQQQHGLGQ